jgi:hypothetical protein
MSIVLIPATTLTVKTALSRNTLMQTTRRNPGAASGVLVRVYLVQGQQVRSRCGVATSASPRWNKPHKRCDIYKPRRQFQVQFLSLSLAVSPHLLSLVAPDIWQNTLMEQRVLCLGPWPGRPAAPRTTQGATWPPGSRRYRRGRVLHVYIHIYTIYLSRTIYIHLSHRCY